MESILRAVLIMSDEGIKEIEAGVLNPRIPAERHEWGESPTVIGGRFLDADERAGYFGAFSLG